MNRGHYKRKTKLIALGLMLVGQFANSQTLPTCPKPSDLQNLNLTINDLKEEVTPHQACCTANGFPYFVEGEWSIAYKFVYVEGVYQWHFSSRAESGRSPDQALKKLNKLFIHLPQPRLYKEYGQWTCAYGSAGVGAYLDVM